MERRNFLRVAAGAGAAVILAPRALLAAAAPVVMTVYKTPTCGCCKEWVARMEQAGFTVKAVDMDDLAEVKHSAGVPKELEACHTALVGSYVVEGHVPPDLIRKMLKEKPKFTGLAVPGMPAGSPGMEQGNARQAYRVMAFVRDGKSRVYASR